MSSQQPKGITRQDAEAETTITGVGSNRRIFDIYNIVYAVLLIHGIGTLMPWNMFINANEYFTNYKLQPVVNGTTDPSMDNIRKNFLSYLGLASQLPNVIFNGVNLLVNMGSGNLRLRVNLTLILEAVIFVVTITLATVDSSQWQLTFFYITLVSVVFLNMASGIYQNCIFGTGAKFPSSYTNAILIGTNSCGIFTSTVNLFAIWLAPEPQEAAIYYFVTALFVILTCIISYNLLPLNQFFRFYDQGGSSTNQEPDATGLELIATVKQDNIPELVERTVEAMTPKPSDQEANSSLTDLQQKWQVFLKCWPQCLNVFLVFYVTLALFPTVLAGTAQKQMIFNDKYFTSFACFFIFNVFAMIGNLISSWTTWPGKQHVWIPVVARFLFVPFFLFCNFNPKTRHWPVLISNDIVFIVGNVLMAMTSGYFSSLCMMFTSSGLKPDEAPKAGMLASFFLVLGVFLGINSSFFLTWIVEIG